MPNVSKAQIEIIDGLFRSLHERNLQAVSGMRDDELFPAHSENVSSRLSLSFGEAILRSAAAVEQTFGGITTRLWDDPFEWTLPEELSTVGKITEYLCEVEMTRQRAFAFFSSDEDLLKRIPAPEQIRPILEILIETLARAEHFRGQALAILGLTRHFDPSARR